MLKTRKRTMSRPRIGETWDDLYALGGGLNTGLIDVAEHSGEDAEGVDIEAQEDNQNTWIDVNIKSRTNTHFDDNFKITVNQKFVKHDFKQY